MILFFDLDGTLIDVKKRHLEVYHIVASRMSLPIVSDEVYWQRKRNHAFPWDTIPKNICEEFRREFKRESENPEHLKFDTVIPGIPSFLRDLQSKHSVVLLTKRYSRPNLLSQLQSLSLFSYFTEILTPNPGTKAQAIQHFTKNHINSSDSVIGDTEEDVSTAQELGLVSVAVSWGLRTKEYLKQLTPSYVLTTVDDLQKLDF